MNFVNRAFKNVSRKMSKSVLLALTFFLIGNLVIIGLGVSNASESAKILTRQKMRAVVTYQLDNDKIFRYVDSIEDEDEVNKFYENYPRIRLAEITELLADTRVKTANATSTATWFPDANKTLDFVHLNNKAEESMGESGQACYFEDDGTQTCETYIEPTFLVKGNMFPSMIEIEDGDYEIKSGRFYNEQEIKDGALVCLVTENFATTNGLSVGDNIVLATSNLSKYVQQAGVTQEDLESTFEVIGIYAHHTPITPDSPNFDYCSPYENPDNLILMPSTATYMASMPMQQKMWDYNAVNYPENEWDESRRPSLENMEELTYIDKVTLLLNDPLEVDKFVEDHQNTISQFTSLDANNEEFKKLAKPLDTLSMYANFIVWLVVINAIVIISLVTALTLKTREYEIGVLLSIGASKFKVIAQFFLELAIVAVIGFTLSVISGSIIAKRLGNTILEYQIATSDIEEEEDSYYSSYIDIWNSDYTTDITIDDLVSEYEVNISPLIIAEIYIMGLGIVFISVIIPSVMIMRYNPKKILMNTN